MLHFCNSITQEAEAGDSRVQGQPEQASKPGSTQQELKIQLSPNALAQHAQDTGLDLLMAQTNKWTTEGGMISSKKIKKSYKDWGKAKHRRDDKKREQVGAEKEKYHIFSSICEIYI